MSRFVLFFFLCLLPSVAFGAAGPWAQDEDVAVRLVSATEGVGQGKNLLFGLEIRLSENAHSYWRAPGLSGLPPSFDWSGSENLAHADLLYPAPKRIGAPPMEVIGYIDHVLMPLQVALQNPGRPLVLKGRLSLLICKGLCLPKTFDLELSLPQGLAAPGKESVSLGKALAALPERNVSSDLRITNADIEDNALILSLEGTHPLSAPDVFLEGPEGFLFEKPSVEKTGGGLRATIKIGLAGQLDERQKLDPALFTATVVDGEHSITVPLAMTAPAPSQPTPLLAILFLALAGGFLLNLMPCVLPVLSLKIMGILRHGGGKKKIIRRAFFSTASGIVFSFLVLAAATITLKASGQVFGWGAQFQQPAFLVFLVVILTIFAASLWGFYELTPPRFVLSVLTPSRHSRLNSDFASGALATLLATPCSAPFLGTAVSFALAASWFEIILVFLALGIGMAAPFLLVAQRPSIAARLPKPGAWMDTLSKALGFGLAGTAAWLLFVLAAQIGSEKVVFIALAMIGLLGLLAWRHRGAPRWGYYPLTIIVLASVFLLALAPATRQPVIAKGPWTPYSDQTLAQALSAGKTVFVNVTADWCLTCKANERFALTNRQVTDKLFGQQGVVALEADWTSSDPNVTTFLNRYGHYGVPFNIVFGPGLPRGFALPEILTPSIVLETLARAQKAPACSTEHNC